MEDPKPNTNIDGFTKYSFSRLTKYQYSIWERKSRKEKQPCGLTCLGIKFYDYNYEWSKAYETCNT